MVVGGAESRKALIPMEEQGRWKDERNVGNVYLINVGDDLQNRCPGNLYRKWGREVTFQVTS